MNWDGSITGAGGDAATLLDACGSQSRYLRLRRHVDVDESPRGPD